MQSKAKTVDEYLASLPDDRREALEQIRAVFRKNLDKRYVENMSYGMAGYAVPLDVYPPGYHCSPDTPLPFAGFASQKNHMSVYLFCLYVGTNDIDEFEAAWKKTGKPLDMGKSCIRFKKIDDVALDVLGKTIKKMTVKRFIGIYEQARADNEGRKPGRPAARKKTAAKKTAAGKKAAKK